MGSTQAPSKRKRPSPQPTATSTKRKKVTQENLQDCMEIAKECLSLSHIPSHIPCRENEHKQIYDYLKNSILQKGNGSPLYISGRTHFSLFPLGMPGTGKTATVREVIRELKEDYVFDVGDNGRDVMISILR